MAHAVGVEQTDSKPRRIDNQSRVVVPPEVLTALGVERGDFIRFKVEGKDVTVKAVKWVEK